MAAEKTAWPILAIRIVVFSKAGSVYWSETCTGTTGFNNSNQYPVTLKFL
jgi:hypothetical protein